MKLKRLFLAGLLTCGLGIHGRLLAETVALGTGEWEPYTSQHLAGYGVFAEVVTAVFKEMGVEPQYNFYPWKRAEQKLQTGEVFAIFPYVTTRERQQAFDFSEKVMTSFFVLFYLKNNYPPGLHYTQLSDLAPYRVGGVHGYWYEGPFEAAGVKVDYAITDEQAIRKLYSKRVQFTAAGELVGWTLIHRLYPDKAAEFATLGPLQHDDLRLMISRQYPHAAELTRRFNAGLRSLRQKGTLDHILAKYGFKEPD